MCICHIHVLLSCRPEVRDIAGWTVAIDALRPGGGVELGGSPVICLLGSYWLVQK